MNTVTLREVTKDYADAVDYRRSIETKIETAERVVAVLKADLATAIPRETSALEKLYRVLEIRPTPPESP